jgi:hypothetical protein
MSRTFAPEDAANCTAKGFTVSTYYHVILISYRKPEVEKYVQKVN